MWIRPASVFFFLATARSVFAQSTTPFDTTALLSELPSCALPCLISVLISPTSPCGLNQTCICETPEIQANATSCILSACTVKEALATQRVSNNACGVPLRNRQSELYVLTSVLLCLAIIAIGMRFYVKLFMNEGPSSGLASIGADDWTILSVVLFGIPSVLLTCLGAVKHGLGRDLWTLTEEDITLFAKYLYVLQLCYAAAMPLIKVSLVFFYMRIFPARPIQRVLYATLALNAAYAIVFVLVSAFSCAPVSFFWTGWDGEHEGRCVNRNAVTWANAAIGIALDVLLLAIPLSQLHGLKMHWKKKIGVGFMFVVGSFITVVSILRLHSLLKYGASLNQTWDNVPASVWSTIELTVGMICTCLPTMRILLVRLFPVMDGTLRAKMRSTFGSGNSSSKPEGKSSHASKGGHSRGWSFGKGSKGSKATESDLDVEASAGLSKSNSAKQVYRYSIGGGRIKSPPPQTTHNEKDELETSVKQVPRYSIGGSRLPDRHMQEKLSNDAISPTDHPELRPLPPLKGPPLTPLKGPEHYRPARERGHKYSASVGTARAPTHFPSLPSLSTSGNSSPPPARGPGRLNSAGVGGASPRGPGRAHSRTLSSSWRLGAQDLDGVYRGPNRTSGTAQWSTQSPSRDHIALHVRKPPPGVISYQKAFQVSYSEKSEILEEDITDGQAKRSGFI